MGSEMCIRDSVRTEGFDYTARRIFTMQNFHETRLLYRNKQFKNSLTKIPSNQLARERESQIQGSADPKTPHRLHLTTGPKRSRYVSGCRSVFTLRSCLLSHRIIAPTYRGSYARILLELTHMRDCRISRMFNSGIQLLKDKQPYHWLFARYDT